MSVRLVIAGQLLGSGADSRTRHGGRQSGRDQVGRSSEGVIRSEDGDWTKSVASNVGSNGPPVLTRQRIVVDCGAWCSVARRTALEEYLRYCSQFPPSVLEPTSGRR